MGQQADKLSRVDIAHSLDFVHVDSFVCHIRADCTRRGRWHMVAAGKVQNQLQARSTTFQPSADS